MNRTAEIYQKWQLNRVFTSFFAKICAWLKRIFVVPNSRFPRLGSYLSSVASRAYNLLRCCLTRGGGQIFAIFAYIQNYAWYIFPWGQFSKSDQESDQKVAGHLSWSVSQKWTVFFYKCLLVLLWLLISSAIVGGAFPSPTRGGISARKIPNGSEEIFITGVGIDGGCDDRFVPGEPLRDPDILCSPVEIRACSVPQTMEFEAPSEPSAFLPYTESMPELPSREPLVIAAYKQRGGFADILAFLFFPAQELSSLGAENIRQDHLLPIHVIAASFVDPKLDSSPNLSASVEYVANVQSQYFVFPESRAQSEAEDYVVAESSLTLSAYLEQKPLFKFGQCFGRLRNVIGIVHVIGSFDSLPPDTFRRAFAVKAREPAVRFGAEL